MTFLSFDTPQWMLLEEVDDCEQLSLFVSNEKWNIFSLGKDYLDFVAKYSIRNMIVNKQIVFCFFLFFFVFF